ncbi:hypothetical protein WICPIJ_002576 [Wickerhamomyces pijperi]|uniref:Uncharacterized protein n=1 Tax=Wickerhamomyces pijperi TaxID=599730 RepID=A0A9P8QBC0_WICPI|nr:hypothetical protein WICPIJ_002576 [Wickerhamomyces pijperi]
MVAINFSLRYLIPTIPSGSKTPALDSTSAHDWLLVVNQGIDNERTVLQDFVVHVTLTTRETSPVGQDHQWQLFTVVEIVDGLSSLEGRVWIPDLTSFLDKLFGGALVGWISRDQVLDVLIEQTGLELTFVGFTTTDHPSDVVRFTTGWSIVNVSVPGVGRFQDWNWHVTLGWNVRQPRHDLFDTGQVIRGSQVRNTVSVHDLSTT